MATRGNANGEHAIPGFLTQFESDDIVALVTPRPFIGLSGSNDHIFPFDGPNESSKGHGRLRRIGRHGKINGGARAPHIAIMRESWAAWKAVIDPKCWDDTA